MLGCEFMLHPAFEPEPPEDHGDDLVVAPTVVIPSDALHYSFARSSGPGGQNVNKRSTKCSLRVALAELPLSAEQLARLCAMGARYLTEDGELVISCDEHRSAPRNKQGCADRLRDLVAGSLIAPRVRKATRPGRGARERRLGDKRADSERKRRRRGDRDD